ncbi:MAG: polyphenol oxidase family protein [Gemmatimonadetes bacterium]|nr:polyphenol oxidase family protein [Gemmatimonadota bacterium]
MSTAQYRPGPPITALEESPSGDQTVPRLELASWADRFGLIAGITTRAHGFSLGLGSEESVVQVMGRWRAFRTAVAARFPAVVLSHQVHGTEVAWHQVVPSGWLILDGLDGHATAAPGVLLTITVADCVPAYLAVPDRGAIALVHAGWRGIGSGVLGNAVKLLRERTGCESSQIVMHCGVGICGECYEVGSEVAFKLLGKSTPGPTRVDLRALLVQQAEALGVKDISVSPWCSAHDRDRFFSHRASKGRDGRMVAYLGIPVA